MRKEHLYSAVVLLGLLLWPGINAVCFSQGIPSVINEVNDGNLPIERQLNPLKTEELEKKEAIDKESGLQEAEIEVDHSPTQETDEALNETKIYLKELKIIGVTKLPGELLSEKLDPYIGQHVTYQDLLNIAYEVTQLYKSLGYITTQAIIPPQKVEGDVVFMQVIEGTIGEIKIAGNKHVRKAYVAKRVNFNEDDVFQISMLERDIIKLNQNKLFNKVKAVIAPGETPGTSDVILNVEDRRPYHLNLGFDNMGRELIGFYRYSATFTHDNVLGFGDSFLANAAVSTDQNTKSLFYQYKFPITTSGWSIGANHAISDVDIGGKLEEFNINSKSNRLSVFTEIPIIKKERHGLTFDAALNAVDATTFIDGNSLEEFTNTPFDSVRSLGFNLTYNEQDTKGRTILKTGVETGIGWMGGNQKYSKFTADAIRVHSLPKGIIWLLKSNGQWAFQNLTSLAQYQVGGASTVRGYREGAVIGDMGYYISSEFRVPLFGVPEPIKKRFQGVVFMDHGGAFVHGSEFQPDASGTPGYLTSMGVGLRGAMNKYLTTSVDLAMILNSKRTEPNFRVHFNLGSQLF